MKYIEDIDVKNKKVILRADFNVTIKDGIILDDTKIKKCIPTIKYLLNNNARILIMSHLGNIKTEEDKLKNSLLVVAERLSDLLNTHVKFIPATRGKILDSALEESNIVLMENTRFEDYPEKLESKNDLELAKYWSSLGEVFINDAFGTTHRCHASNYGISLYLPSAYGFLINEEIIGLEPIINDIKKPFTVIMGGAKVDDKVSLIETLLKECNYLLVGGGIANTFLKASGYNIGLSLYSEDYVLKVSELLKQYKDKIYMPVDVVVKEGTEIKTYNINEIPINSYICDIGPNTIELYSTCIKNSETIFVNGTMGLYEEKEFRDGTEKLYKELSGSKSILIAGGGDTVASVNKLGYENIFDFLSTGGGATLEYIANKEINCFKER